MTNSTIYKALSYSISLILFFYSVSVCTIITASDSNNITDSTIAIKLRSTYASIKSDDVRKITHLSILEKKTWGYKAYSTIKNVYHAEKNRRDRIVKDHTTGLMWYQGGSKAKYLTHTDAKAWVKKQNRRGYAGFTDWRLPTLEEATSLLESSKKEGLCIDPIFSKDQEWIWTGDRRGNGEAWRISFSLGGLCGTSINNTRRSIRPVRTWKTLETDREPIPERHDRTFHKQSTIVQQDSNTTPDNLRTTYEDLPLVNPRSSYSLPLVNPRSSYSLPLVNLRSSYSRLSVDEARAIPNIKILKKKFMGFSGYSTITHNYEVKTINGDQAVLDHATGLMWHKSGSDEHMSLKKGKKWVKDLNRKSYVGYKDWRLPTVEEASSLLESAKKNSDLFIDPAFDKHQQTILTGDSHGSYGAWRVNFAKGYVNWNYLINGRSYVRPVREGG